MADSEPFTSMDRILAIMYGLYITINFVGMRRSMLMYIAALMTMHMDTDSSGYLGKPYLP